MKIVKSIEFYSSDGGNLLRIKDHKNNTNQLLDIMIYRLDYFYRAAVNQNLSAMLLLYDFNEQINKLITLYKGENSKFFKLSRKRSDGNFHTIKEVYGKFTRPINNPITVKAMDLVVHFDRLCATLAVANKLGVFNAHIIYIRLRKRYNRLFKKLMINVVYAKLDKDITIKKLLSDEISIGRQDIRNIYAALSLPDMPPVPAHVHDNLKNHLRLLISKEIAVCENV